MGRKKKKKWYKKVFTKRNTIRVLKWILTNAITPILVGIVLIILALVIVI